MGVEWNEEFPREYQFSSHVDNPSVFAHEIGHIFGLEHIVFFVPDQSVQASLRIAFQDNLMSTPAGTDLFASQCERARAAADKINGR